MWMQILTAAGLPVFGEEFPRRWGETIREANPDGFYESILRQGIYWRTNPHPKTGAFFHPAQVEKHVVKVFIPGLTRTDLAYIGRVLATVRHWRDYCGSIERLYAMEDEGAEPDKARPPRPTPWLEWWSENFALIRDVATRRHPVHVQSYDDLLKSPDRVIPEVLSWIGVEGLDADAGVQAVRPEHRSQTRPDVDVDANTAGALDLLFDHMVCGEPLSRAAIQRLNDINTKMAPRIDADRRRMEAERGPGRNPRRGGGAPPSAESSAEPPEDR